MQLTIGEKIKILSKRQGKTITQLAEATGQTRQNLTNKMNRDNFSEQEAREIGKVLDAEFFCFFRMPDGTEI